MPCVDQQSVLYATISLLFHLSLSLSGHLPEKHFSKQPDVGFLLRLCFCSLRFKDDRRKVNIEKTDTCCMSVKYSLDSKHKLCEMVMSDTSSVCGEQFRVNRGIRGRSGGQGWWKCVCSVRSSALMLAAWRDWRAKGHFTWNHFILCFSHRHTHKHADKHIVAKIYREAVSMF